jgi:hypothetical protein
VQLRIHFVLVVLLCCGATSAQVDRLPSKVKISDTDLASCYEEATGKLLGSQLVRSHVLISPGGRYRAYTEVEAVASKSKASSDWECANTSRLFVAAEDQPFRQVLVVEPSPESMGNSIGIVDWSPDGRTLLFAQGVFQWVLMWERVSCASSTLTVAPCQTLSSFQKLSANAPGNLAPL